MNISYNWLKEYVDFDLTPDEVAAALTSIGLKREVWKRCKLLKADWKDWSSAKC